MQKPRTGYKDSCLDKLAFLYGSHVHQQHSCGNVHGSAAGGTNWMLDSKLLLHNFYGIELYTYNKLDIPLETSSKTEHGLWYTVDSFEVTHNHINNQLNTYPKLQRLQCRMPNPKNESLTCLAWMIVVSFCD